MRHYIITVYLKKKSIQKYLITSFLLGITLGFKMYVLNKNVNIDPAQLYFIQSSYYTGTTAILVFSMPIISSVLFAKLYFEEKELLPVIYSKFKARSFQRKRIIYIIAFGFLVSLIFFLSNFTILALSGAFNRTRITQLFGNYRINIIDNPTPFYTTYINNPFLFSLIYMVLLSFWFALSGAIGYVIAFMTQNKLAAYLSSFYISLLILMITTFFSNGISTWSPYNLVMPFPVQSNHPGIFSIEKGIIVLFLFYIIFIVLILKISFRKDVLYEE